MRYKPDGEDRDTGSSLNTDRKFTGQTEDEAAGLYWYASRAYDPAIGRFVSPDSIVPDPLNPQSLNRYGYVLNNPLKLVDPSGRTPKPKAGMSIGQKNMREITVAEGRLGQIGRIVSSVF